MTRLFFKLINLSTMQQVRKLDMHETQAKESTYLPSLAAWN